MLFLLWGCRGDGTGPGGVRAVTVSAPFTSVTVGQSVQLTATVTDARGTVVTGSAIRWKSAPEAVAAVDASGLVSAVSPGAVTVTATSGRATGSIALSVTPNPRGTVTVTMPGFSFTPHTTRISAGATVNFEFPQQPHNVIFRAAGSPPDIPETSNRTVPRTFSVAGTFPYDCTLHPGMSGVVVAQ